MQPSYRAIDTVLKVLPMDLPLQCIHQLLLSFSGVGRLLATQRTVLIRQTPIDAATATTAVAPNRAG